MKLQNITKVYHNKHSDVTALDNITLDIHQKGVTAIVGASGCGKTTLLHIISGQDKHFTGARNCEEAMEIIEQEIMLFESMSVIDNLKLVSEDDERIEQLLLHFQMQEFKQQKVKKLSIGQKKRVQIIRSLLSNPGYMLCDEPTAALDHENAILVMEMLKEVSEHIGVVIVTHEISIVEAYADVIVSMGKGCIEKIEVRNKQEEKLSIKNKEHRKNGEQHLQFLAKQITSRIGEHLFLFIVIFVLCISLFSSMLFSSISKSVEGKEKWRTSENFITTQPNDGNDIYRPISKYDDSNSAEDMGKYYYYDLYTNEDIRLVKDNIPKVIGYQVGWDVEKCNEMGSFAPAMTYSQMGEELEKAEKKALAENRELNEKENFWKEILKNNSPEGNEHVFWDMRNYLGFGETYSRIDSSAPINLGDFYDNVYPYQIFNHYELPIQYGKNMKKDDEIVIPYNLAQQLIKVYELSSVDQLIGQETDIYCTRIKKEDQGDTKILTPEKLVTFKIVGITYYSNENEYQFYMREGVWDKLLSDFYEFNEKYLTYTNVDFIVNENEDTMEVAQKVDELLDSKESHFISKSSVGQTKEGYQNNSLFNVFTMILCFGMVVLLVLAHIIIRNREKKEQYLLNLYGYHARSILIFKVILLFIIVGIIQMLCLPVICEYLNAIANSLGFAYMIQNDLTSYLITWVMALIIIMVIEILFYQFRNSKK